MKLFLAQYKRNLYLLAAILYGNTCSKRTAAVNAARKDTKRDSASHRCTKQLASDHITGTDGKEKNTQTAW